MSPEEHSIAGDPADPLLAAYADGELDEETRKRVKEHLDTCKRCHELLKAQQGMVKLLDHSRFEGIQNEEFDRYWEDLQPRLTRHTSSSLAWLGMIALFALGITALTFSDLSFIVKIASGITLLGLLSWFMTVWMEKQAINQNDPYRKVQR